MVLKRQKVITLHPRAGWVRVFRPEAGRQPDLHEVKRIGVKKFFFMVAFWLVSVLTIVVGSGIYKKFLSNDYDETVRPYVRHAITEISKWDPANTRALMAAEVAEKIPEDKFNRAMAWFSRLGELQSMDDPAFERSWEDLETELGKQTVIEYNTEARYTNGEATINLKLVSRNGHYELYSFNFSSQTLLE